MPNIIKRLNGAVRKLEHTMAREEKSFIKSFGRDVSRHTQDRYAKHMPSVFGRKDSLRVDDIRFKRLKNAGRIEGIRHRFGETVQGGAEAFADTVAELAEKIDQNQLRHFSDQGKIRRAYLEIAAGAGLNGGSDVLWCYFISSNGSGRIEEVWIGTSETPPSATANSICYGHEMIVSFIQDSPGGSYRTVR